MGRVVTPASSAGLLAVAVDFLELGVDDVVRRAGSVIRGGGVIAAGLALLSLVHGLAQLHRSLDEGLGLGRDRVGVTALQRPLQVLQSRRNRVALGLADLVAVLGHGLFGRVDDRVGLVLGLDGRLALLVVGLVGLGFLDHG